MMARWFLLGFLNLLPATAFAARALMEGTTATALTIFPDTGTGRVDIATGNYVGGIANVGLFVASNVVISADSINECVVYSTGSLTCQTVLMGGVKVSTTSLWTASGNNIYNNNSSNVGIGVTSPGTLLSVKSGSRVSQANFYGGGKYGSAGGQAASGQIAVGLNSTDQGLINFNDGGNTNFIFENTFADVNDEKFDFVANGSTRMAISGNGNVGIGTVAPGYLLDVSGTARVTSTLQLGLEIISNNCTTQLSCTATCSAGKSVLGGGCNKDTSNTNLSTSYPASSTTWTCTINTGDTNFTAYAICARMGST